MNVHILINQKIDVSSGKIIRNKIILKNLNTYGKKFSIDEILYSIKILRNCDLISKTTSMNERYLVHSIIVDICEGVNV